VCPWFSGDGGVAGAFVLMALRAAAGVITGSQQSWLCLITHSLTHWCTALSHPIHPIPPTAPPVTHHREARWLVATCWNTGLDRLRIGDRRTAAPFLRTGLDMMRHVGGGWGVGADRGAMERVAAEAEAAAPTAAGAVGAA